MAVPGGPGYKIPELMVVTISVLKEGDRLWGALDPKRDVFVMELTPLTVQSVHYLGSDTWEIRGTDQTGAAASVVLDNLLLIEA